MRETDANARVAARTPDLSAIGVLVVVMIDLVDPGAPVSILRDDWWRKRSAMGADQADRLHCPSS
jgi:hypothetical protein